MSQHSFSHDVGDRPADSDPNAWLDSLVPADRFFGATPQMLSTRKARLYADFADGHALATPARTILASDLFVFCNINAQQPALDMSVPSKAGLDEHVWDA